MQEILKTCFPWFCLTLYILFSNSQAAPGRPIKQEQEPISSNF